MLLLRAPSVVYEMIMMLIEATSQRAVARYCRLSAPRVAAVAYDYFADTPCAMHMFCMPVDTERALPICRAILTYAITLMPSRRVRVIMFYYR